MDTYVNIQLVLVYPIIIIQETYPNQSCVLSYLKYVNFYHINCLTFLFLVNFLDGVR